MKVKDFIKELEKLDPELWIVGRGYEGGYYKIDTPSETVTMVADCNDQWYYGPHETLTGLEYRSDYDQVKNNPQFQAVII